MVEQPHRLTGDLRDLIREKNSRFFDYDDLPLDTRRDKSNTAR